MTKKDFISAAKYYGLTVSYSGNRMIWFVKRDNTVLQLAGYVVRESKSFTEVMFNHTENIFDTYKKEREKLNGNVPAGTPKTPPNGTLKGFELLHLSEFCTFLYPETAPEKYQ